MEFKKVKRIKDHKRVEIDQATVVFHQYSQTTESLVVEYYENSIIVEIRRDSPCFNHAYSESIAASSDENLNKLEDACKSILSIIEDIRCNKLVKDMKERNNRKDDNIDS